MDALNSFRLTGGPLNFRLIDRLEFILNDGIVNFKLNAVTLADGSFRLLEDDFVRLLEDGTYRLLE
jgi:hypothetical protein